MDETEKEKIKTERENEESHTHSSRTRNVFKEMDVTDKRHIETETEKLLLEKRQK